MFQRFAQGRFELIHMHSPWLVARAALLQARRHRLPLVFTYHTTFDQYLHYIPLSPVFVRPLAWAVLRRTVRACDRVLAPSPEVAAALTRGGLAGTTVHTLPTGINVAQVAAGCRARGREWLRLGSEAEVLMYVGRIAPEILGWFQSGEYLRYLPSEAP
jgi:glycosyltransferase involved in cell wall biosynthesis